MSQGQTRFQKFQSLLQTDELAPLGPEPRAMRDSFQSLESKLRQAFLQTPLPESAQPLIRSLVFLWHDYLDESHSISQDIHSADGSFLHGIMHRREPDYGNAKYWFHRVRDHACFPVIAKRVGALLAAANATALSEKLIHNGDWDAFAFVDACEMGLLKNDAETIALLEQIQEIEFNSLLEHFLHQSTPSSR